MMEMGGRFRVLSFERWDWLFPNSSIDTCSLGIVCDQSFNSILMLICDLAPCSVVLAKRLVVTCVLVACSFTLCSF